MDNLETQTGGRRLVTFLRHSYAAVQRHVHPGLRLGVLLGGLAALSFAVTGWPWLGMVVGVVCILAVVGLLGWAPPHSKLVWLALLIPLFTLPDLVLGEPSRSRVMLVVALSLGAVAVTRGLERLNVSITIRNADRIVFFGLLLYVMGAWAAISYKYLHFGDRSISQDTAYFEQCFWGFATGRNFFMGSSQDWWRYDPPLTSHFAMHFSPIMFLVAPFYALWQSYHVLHLVQIVVVSSAAVPIYKLVRDIDPLAALLFTLAYLLNGAVLSQTQVAFHELAFAAPVAAWAVYFFLKQRLGAYLITLAAGMLVREDLALLACMGSVAGLLTPGLKHRRWAWVVLPGVIGVTGWVVAAQAMHAFGNNGDQVVNSLFARFGSTQREIVVGMLSRPQDVVAMMLEEHRSRYVLGLLRPGLFAALLHPISLLVAPVLAINLLVRGAGTAWLDAHYTVYLPPVLIGSAIFVWLKLAPRLARWANASIREVRAVVAGLMILAGMVNFLDAFPVHKIKAYFPPEDEADTRAVLAVIPPEAAVAAPRFMLHAIGKREILYMVNRWSTYIPYKPEYIVVDRDFRKVQLADGSYAPYAAYAAFLAADPARFEVLVETPRYRLYRDRYPGAAQSPAQVSEAK